MTNQEQQNLGFVRQYFGEIDDTRTFTAKEIWGIMNIFNPLVPRNFHDVGCEIQHTGKCSCGYISQEQFNWEKIIEKLADIEHQRWSDWQSYLHKKLEYSEYEKDGKRMACYVLNAGDYEHWQKQVDTPYSDLSEREKESDREQVRRYLPLLEETCVPREEWEYAMSALTNRSIFIGDFKDEKISKLEAKLQKVREWCDQPEIELPMPVSKPYETGKRAGYYKAKEELKKIIN
jgi:hypothetical protein